MNLTNGQHDITTGEYETVTLLTHSPDEQLALEERNALYRAAKRQRKGLRTKLYTEPNGDWIIQFTVMERAYTKAAAYDRRKQRY